MSEQRFLICLPQYMTPADMDTSDQVEGICTRCQRKVWISKTGYVTMLRPGVRILCYPCSVDQAVESDEAPIVIPPSEEQLAALEVSGITADKVYETMEYLDAINKARRSEKR